MRSPMQQRLVDVVGDEDDGRRVRAPGVDEQALHGGAGLGVQCAERLVHHDGARRAGQAAGELHALAHAAGQALRAGTSSKPVSPTSAIQRIGRARGDPARATPAQLERAARRWIARCATGSSASSWKTSARSRDVAVTRRAVGEDLARIGWQQAGEGAQHGRLAAAGGSGQDQDLARCDVEVEPVDDRLRRRN